MAVSGITNSNSLLISALSRRGTAALRPVATQAGGLNSNAAAVPASLGVATRRQTLQPTTFLPQNAGVTTPVSAATTLIVAPIPPAVVPLARTAFNIIQANVPPAPVVPQITNVATPPQAGAPLTAAPIPTLQVPLPAAQLTIIPPAPVQITIPPQDVTLAAAVAPSQAVIPTPAIAAVPAQLAIIPPAPVQITVPPQNVALAAAVAPSQAVIPTPAIAAAPAPLTIIPPAPVQITVPPQNVTLAAAEPLTQVALAAPEVSPADAIVQNALLVNEILRNVGYTAAVPAASQLFDTRSPLLTALQATGELNLIQQSALQVNETLRNLGYTATEPASPLLIDVVPPALEAAEIPGALTPLAENALFVNETLQNLAANRQVANQPQLQPVAAPPALTTAEARIPATAGPAEVAPVIPPTPAPATAPAPVTSTATTDAGGGAVPLPATGTFLAQELTPTTLPVVLFPDRIPYVLVVYQINDPAPLPSSLAEPIDVDVPPAAAVAKIRAVGNARFRQAQFRERAREQSGNTEYHETLATGAQVESSIRSSLDRVNADMAAQDRPFHLVFAKRKNNFALDVYDCSYSDSCRKTYDVPIPLNNLAGILNKMAYKTGMIVDTNS